MQNIRGYYNREKYICQFGLITWNSFIYQFLHPVGEKGLGKTGWKLGIGILFCCKFYFIIENMKIWGNIQVIIYPFLAICLKFLFKIAVMFQFRPRLNNLLAFQLQVSCSKLYNSRKSRTSTSAKSEREAVHIFSFYYKILAL